MSRNYTIDLIKFFAMYFIVAIHTSPFKEIQIGVISGANINFVINTFARFAVPFFFIVSGYFFGAKNFKSNFTSNHFKKYIFNLLLLYFT
jgi:surface polysaccharide O-acyltransferase-like enzyme